ncbi:MAG TPA: hypothetical protein VGM75_12505 [Pseudonocardiaceae bacterium]|jgi:hypothetical protein
MRVTKSFTAAALVAAAIAAPVLFATTASADAAGLHAQVTIAAAAPVDDSGTGPDGTPWE